MTSPEDGSMDATIHWLVANRIPNEPALAACGVAEPLHSSKQVSRVTCVASRDIADAAAKVANLTDRRSGKPDRRRAPRGDRRE